MINGKGEVTANIAMRVGEALTVSPERISKRLSKIKGEIARRRNLASTDIKELRREKGHKDPFSGKYNGRAGGIKGGPARAKKLSRERRQEIGRMGGKASHIAKSRNQQGQWGPL
jgi:general stress protein YciG